MKTTLKNAFRAAALLATVGASAAMASEAVSYDQVVLVSSDNGQHGGRDRGDDRRGGSVTGEGSVAGGNISGTGTVVGDGNIAGNGNIGDGNIGDGSAVGNTSGNVTGDLSGSGGFLGGILGD